ncbi:ammonia-dependent NAD(+) synthetase [Loigolactobacillus rennini]|uniref:NH(3)-dependent NAD(+) synthetase n=1 Tax=Loigolactobacillus rennini DSM 20253 TaxID=1423796 RepID=A0A0R2D028_9LACO|nr:ammonia-dependent NAD(+) synthetase [Loigolactobacillus rennini]KRM97416.1 NAD synthetase [Loigolactobacillus rennini DSM 20253]
MRPLQKEIIAAMKTQPQIDPQKEIRKSVDFLKAYLKKFPFIKTLVLGISGGQDSTLAGRLGQLAISEMRTATHDDSYQFIAVRLPYGEQADESDALAALDFIQPDETMRVNIKPAVDATVAALTPNQLAISDFNKGNIKARQRMLVQYAIAGARAGAVLGTDHAAESVTGFYTKYGDGASDLVPLYRLDKRQGQQLLQTLGAPAKLYQKVPTADLEEDHPAQPDEVALGVSYQDIDDYLEGKAIATPAAEKIENWYRKTAHKRHLPITLFDNFWK